MDADETVAFDLLQPDAMAPMLRTARPDGVVHLAAQASVSASFADPMASWRANLLGTLALGEAVLREAPVRRRCLELPTSYPISPDSMQTISKWSG